MNQRIEAITKDLASLASEVQHEFGELTSEQLNWKPDPNSWSVAQCFDHLIVSHSLYFPLLERLAGEAPEPTVWERLSPLSGLFGNLMVHSLKPDNTRKLKTTAKAHPSASRIDDGIITRYLAHQAELIDRIQALPGNLPLSTVVTSPLMGLVTYSLEDALTILAVHGRRHRDQARRVMATAGFPQPA
ncbi:MAG: DinB family protein [Rhodothermales bacterium]